MKTPYLYENEKTFGIFGSAEALTALAELILLKVKLRQNLSATLTDGVNKPIRIVTEEELVAKGE